MYILDFISSRVHPPSMKMHENEEEKLIQVLVKSDRDMLWARGVGLLDMVFFGLGRDIMRSSTL